MRVYGTIAKLEDKSQQYQYNEMQQLQVCQPYEDIDEQSSNDKKQIVPVSGAN